MFKRKRNIIFIIIVVGLIGSACSNSFMNKDEKVIPNQGLAQKMDVSSDDKEIVFSYYKNGVAAIYTANPDGSNVKKFVEMKDVSLLHPKLSTDGKKLLFLASPKGKEDKKQSLYVIDRDGKNKKQLTSTDGLVTDAVFLPDNQNIFYLQAGVVKNYSPIASKRPHEYDLYSINSNGSEKKQITNQKEYGMFDLSISADGKSLWFTKEKDSERALFITSLNGKETFNKILPKEEIGTPEMYDVALSEDNHQIVFSAVSPSSKNASFEYELFSMDLATKQTEQLTQLKSHASSPVYFHKENKILFLEDKNWSKKSTSKFEMYTMDLSNKQIAKIDLSVSN
ncbi:DPP IV N-terminal domain-containing protein [Bacillus sp. ISL-75]|uniref:DPP IV N-terminal domain-containing protein n=1 Tax=Bacillus sp. ISL-75 TaxID=2819137 RepID=UPI001BE92973|nr:DPP IV N-terminal domain-containing protein [Bacillus sp. ISL-75]MBT2730447.1 DPP IV N-terminal domain-containing protein [Bacillus sp. ISL-75]